MLSLLLCLFSSLTPRPPRPTLFPYTTLFRSVAGTRSFRDHHRYTAADIAAIRDAARIAGAEAVVTTEKDAVKIDDRSEEHTSELQSRPHLVCRLLHDKKKIKTKTRTKLKKKH